MVSKQKSYHILLIHHLRGLLNDNKINNYFSSKIVIQIQHKKILIQIRNFSAHHQKEITNLFKYKHVLVSSMIIK